MTTNSWDWGEYYEKYKDAPRTRALDIAVQKFCNDRGCALDIGAGNLRDSKYLLDQGFVVVAVDPSPLSAKFAQELNNPSLTLISKIIEQYEFPKDHFSVVNAQGMMFHFLEPTFSSVIQKVKDSLKSGGVFCTEFMGERDGWNYPGTTKTITTREQLKDHLEGFDIVFEKDVENDAVPVFAEMQGSSEPKHWHIIKIIAIKK